MKKYKLVIVISVCLLVLVLLIGNVLFAYLYLVERDSTKDLEKQYSESLEEIKSAGNRIAELEKQLGVDVEPDTTNNNETENISDVEYDLDDVSLDKVAVTIDEPELIEFVYPDSWGDVEMTSSDDCASLHEGKDTIRVRFADNDAFLDFFTCGLGGGGYTEYESYDTTLASGEAVSVTINEYESSSDYYYVTASTEDNSVFFSADVPKSTYEDDVQTIVDLLESVVIGYSPLNTSFLDFRETAGRTFGS